MHIHDSNSLAVEAGIYGDIGTEVESDWKLGFCQRIVIVKRVCSYLPYKMFI